MKNYQVAFGKAVMGSFGWLTGILVLLRGSEMNLVGIVTAFVSAIVIGAVLTIGYPLIWKNLSINRIGKIILSAVLNISAELAISHLLVPEMFTRIFPWTLGMVALSCAIHFVTSTFHYNNESTNF